MLLSEMDFHSTLLPRKSAKGLPAGLGILVFVILWIVTSGLMANFISSLSTQIAVATGALVGLAGGIVTYRAMAKISRRQRARVAREMQANRAAETEKQITEMKRQAAEAEGRE